MRSYVNAANNGDAATLERRAALWRQDARTAIVFEQ
jgi:hypothetical protein